MRLRNQEWASRSGDRLTIRSARQRERATLAEGLSSISVPPSSASSGPADTA